MKIINTIIFFVGITVGFKLLIMDQLYGIAAMVSVSIIINEINAGNGRANGYQNKVDGKNIILQILLFIFGIAIGNMISFFY